MNISSNQIRAARHLLDIRQKDLAEHLGVGAPVLSQWENGLKLPKQRIAEIVDYFKSCGLEVVSEPGREGVLLHHNGHINGTD